MIISRTPFRLSFFGGGTDYNAWFEQHGGQVVATTMAYYCYLSVRRLPPFFEDHISRVVYSNIESVKDHKQIKHPSVRGCLEYLGITTGVEIHHDGDLPARSGLGSSSAFTVGLLHALHGLQENMIDPQRLAMQAIEVEQEKLGESVGIQDQIMASCGGLQIIEMGPGRDWNTKPLLMSREYQDILESHVLLGFSGISRFAEKNAESKVRNIKEGKTLGELQEISAITQDAIQALMRQDEMTRIGALLDKSWSLKRRLADGVSAEWMDDLYKVACRNGAFGGKLMGAGGGGFFFFLAPPEKHLEIRESLPQIKVWVPFKLDRSGSQIIFYDQQNSVI